MVVEIILIIIGVIVIGYHFLIDTNTAFQQTVQYLGFICGSIFLIGGLILLKMHNKKPSNEIQNNKNNEMIDNRIDKIYVINKKTPLKSGSSTLSETKKILDIGVNVKFKSKYSSVWYCVETLDGEKGFCKSSDLKILG